ncbi:unnamed protein product [Soboliphyme baturini]|uniref:DUF727 domain-containing protein n=1 Tax=Soboliphyme baturini TaxID=241478 RepID=A0A183IQX5_9BILA|nr:unnamed protein product [Soboliphyme baturini]
MNGDISHLNLHTRYFETVYALMDYVSPCYRRRFTDTLSDRLKQLQCSDSVGCNSIGEDSLDPEKNGLEMRYPFFAFGGQDNGVTSQSPSHLLCSDTDAILVESAPIVVNVCQASRLMTSGSHIFTSTPANDAVSFSYPEVN